MIDFETKIGYQRNGWLHLKNVIDEETVNKLRTKAIELRNWVDDKVGTPSKFGPPVHWKGLGCAGMYDSYLMNFYKSDLMYDISSELLETKSVWLYNDQIVVKLPNDKFDFVPHTDNKEKGLNTINLCVILDDFTDENGTLQVLDEKIYPKAGDIVAIHGDTQHQSFENKSNNPRCLYACVYSDERIDFQNFYRTPFKQSLL